MNKTLQIIVVLTGVAILAGGILTVYAVYTQPMIEKNAQLAIQNAIKEVLPQTAAYNILKKLPETVIYETKDEQGNLGGYAVYQIGTGFADRIVLIFGLEPDLKRISGLKILEQKETPGLGALIEDEEVFLKFWKNKEYLAEGFKYAKPPKSAEQLAVNEINAISGATISSRSVTEIVNKAIKIVRQELGR